MMYKTHDKISAYVAVRIVKWLGNGFSSLTPSREVNVIRIIVYQIDYSLFLTQIHYTCFSNYNELKLK